MIFDSLSQREGEFCEHVIKALDGEAWAAPLLKRINTAGGVVRDNKSLLFELQFAYALHCAGIQPAYEIPGERGSTIDFGFTSKGVEWAVEVMRLEETAAVEAATSKRVTAGGLEIFERTLSSTASDPRQSEEGETLKAVQRICQKCEKDGRPFKFPQPVDRLHMILVDFRTFLNGGDEYDRIHVALGGKYLRSGFHRRHYRDKLITGIFDPETILLGAQEARERVHFLGFVNDKLHEPDSFIENTQLVVNPNLFQDEAKARDAIATWPLQPAKALNCR